MRYKRTKAEILEQRETTFKATVERFKLLARPKGMGALEIARFFFEAGWEALRKNVYSPNRGQK